MPGENYLQPTRGWSAIGALSTGFVLDQLEVTGNRMNFIILDACRNNPWTRSFRSASRGLARMDAPRGSLVAYSTGPGQVAADGTGVNSPYSLALARVMQMPGVPAEKMFKLVRNLVIDATNGDQTPWEESSLTGEDFYFAPDAPAAGAATPPASVLVEAMRGADTAATTQQETVFWQSIKDANEVEMFEAYLEQYPSGTFAVLARLRVKQFEKSRRLP